MTEHVQTLLRELKERLTELYGERLQKLVLFGSQARGEAAPDSDIDVLVVLRGPVNAVHESERTLDLRVDWNLKYQALVQIVCVTSERYLAEKSPLLINVRREGVPL